MPEKPLEKWNETKQQPASWLALITVYPKQSSWDPDTLLAVPRVVAFA